MGYQRVGDTVGKNIELGESVLTTFEFIGNRRDAGLRPLHPFPTRRSSDLCWPADWDPCRTPARPCRASAGASSPRSSTSTADALQRSEEHTSELQSRRDFVCRLLLEKKMMPWAISALATRLVRTSNSANLC